MCWLHNMCLGNIWHICALPVLEVNSLQNGSMCTFGCGLDKCGKAHPMRFAQAPNVESLGHPTASESQSPIAPLSICRSICGICHAQSCFDVSLCIPLNQKTRGQFPERLLMLATHLCARTGHAKSPCDTLFSCQASFGARALP